LKPAFLELAKGVRDADSQFAAALRRFRAGGAGNFYLQANEIQGIGDAALNKYARMVQWYSLKPQPR